MTDGIEVSFQPPMDETDKKVLIGLAVEMRVPRLNRITFYIFLIIKLYIQYSL